MTAERAEAIEAITHRQDSPYSPGPAPLRIAEHGERDRFQRLIELANSMLREAELMAGEKLFLDDSHRLQALKIADGIDFFEELKRFEVSLIKLALSQTGGHQARAAKLLNIKPTTLNTKIKVYGIEY